MAGKEELLREIAELAEQGLLSREEVMAAYNAGAFKAAPGGSSINVGPVSAAVPPEEKPAGLEMTPKPLIKRISVAEILFYVGGAIVFLGLVFMVSQNWKALGTAPRLLLTLGAGVAAYYTGLAFSRDERTERAAPAFFLISALILPVGLYVVFDNAGLSASSYGFQSLISAVMLLVYLASYYVYRKSIFVLFSILYGTWVFFSVTSYLVAAGPHTDQTDFHLYQAVVAGISYLLLAQAFARTEHSSICGFLNNFGLLGFLGAALTLGGWKPHQNVFWEVFYPGFVFGALFLSVRVRSIAYLTWGSVFLMLYLIKITNEYFASGMGWPAALVMTGLLLIGVGFMTVTLKRKYLSRQAGPV